MPYLTLLDFNAIMNSCARLRSVRSVWFFELVHLYGLISIYPTRVQMKGVYISLALGLSSLCLCSLCLPVVSLVSLWALYSLSLCDLSFPVDLSLSPLPLVSLLSPSLSLSLSVTSFSLSIFPSPPSLWPLYSLPLSL